MSKQNKQQTNTTSMETLWKVLRVYRKIPFSSGPEHYSGSCICHPAVICTGTFR